MAHGTNDTKLTRSTETFGDLARTCSSKTPPRRKPTTFQLGRLRFGKVQEGKESATKKSTSYASRQEYNYNGGLYTLDHGNKECRKLLDDDETSKTIGQTGLTTTLRRKATNHPTWE